MNDFLLPTHHYIKIRSDDPDQVLGFCLDCRAASMQGHRVELKASCTSSITRMHKSRFCIVPLAILLNSEFSSFCNTAIAFGVPFIVPVTFWPRVDPNGELITRRWPSGRRSLCYYLAICRPGVSNPLRRETSCPQCLQNLEISEEALASSSGFRFWLWVLYTLKGGIHHRT